jgi:hypothetical protein
VRLRFQRSNSDKLRCGTLHPGRISFHWRHNMSLPFEEGRRDCLASGNHIGMDVGGVRRIFLRSCDSAQSGAAGIWR